MDFKKYLVVLFFFVVGVVVGRSTLPSFDSQNNTAATTTGSKTVVAPTTDSRTTTTTTNSSLVDVYTPAAQDPSVISPTTSTNDLTYSCNGTPPCAGGNTQCCAYGGPSTGYTVVGDSCGPGGIPGSSNGANLCTIGSGKIAAPTTTTGTNPYQISPISSTSVDLTYACNGIPGCAVGGACCVSGGPSTGYTVNGNGSGSCEGTGGSVQIGGTCTIGRMMNPTSGTGTTTMSTNGAIIVFNSSIKFGMSGEEVKKLQKALVVLGFLDSKYQTGYFGNITLNAVKAYQTSRGLYSDGSVGPLSRAKLNQDAIKSNIK